MIFTLFITIVIEGLIVLIYCGWQRKQIGPILVTSIVGNFLTQSLLWLTLRLFFQHYLVTLFTAEIFIWLIESFLLHYFSADQLSWREATWLSLGMNTASFGLGWFLPV